MRFLSECSLDPTLLYRVDRYDVDVGMPAAPIDEQIEWCEQHLIRINRREGSYEVGTGRFYRIYDIRFPMWLSSPLRLLRYAGSTALAALMFPFRALLALARKEPTQNRLLAAARTAVSLPRLVRYAWFEERALMRMHTNGCGDFTLLSREGWAATEGYPELELFSFFIDGLFMYEAHYAGFRETLLPYRIYHMEHGGGWRPDDEGLNELVTHLDRRGIPRISYQQFLDWAIQMYRTNRGVLPRSPTWGFSEEPLPERLVVGSGALASAAGIVGDERKVAL
jgi:hypothetical protein